MTIQRLWLISCAVIGLGLTAGYAQEKATYTAPVVANKTEGEIYQVILARTGGRRPAPVVAAGDVIVANHTATGTFGAYNINARAGAGTITWSIRNNTAGSLSEAIVLSFCVIKGVTS